MRRGGGGIFVLVRTSNAGGDLQDVILTDGRPMWHHVASLVAEWGEETIGERRASRRSAPSSARRIRARSPRRVA